MVLTEARAIARKSITGINWVVFVMTGPSFMHSIGGVYFHVLSWKYYASVHGSRLRSLYVVMLAEPLSSGQLQSLTSYLVVAHTEPHKA